MTLLMEVISILCHTDAEKKKIELTTQSVLSTELLKNSMAPILPVKSISALHQFIGENPGIIYTFMLSKLKKAIKHNMEYVELFQIEGTKHIALIERSSYEKSIMVMKNWFIKTEEYENAGVCNKLLDRHNINILLSTTNDISRES